MTTHEPEQIYREAARKAAAMVRPYSHNSALILAGERDGTDIVQAALHGLRLGIEQGKRMAGGDMEYAAEMLANFARDRFANTKELTWATMGEHSQQYFRDAVEVVRAALTEQQEEG